MNEIDISKINEEEEDENSEGTSSTIDNGLKSKKVYLTNN